MKIDQEALYEKSHEFVRPEGDLFVLGISDYAQDSLGDIVFIELPKVGAQLKKADVLGVVESVKAASDLYAPIDGEIVEVNVELAKSPELINQDPFGKGWIAKVKSKGSLQGLLTAKDYEEFCKGL